MEAAHRNLLAQLPRRPHVPFLDAIAKVAQESLDGTLFGVARIQLQLLVHRELAHVDARVTRELGQGANDVRILHSFSILCLRLLHGAAEDRVDCGEELDGVRVSIGGPSNIAGRLDLAGSLGRDEAADVDSFGMLGSKGLTNLGGACLEDDPGNMVSTEMVLRLKVKLTESAGVKGASDGGQTS